MHISYKPLWHTLLERDMRKEDLRLAAGMTTNMIANMSKEGKHISMDTLARICETLNCETPYYMIPKHMHCLEQFPLNTSSKTDRKKIQELI